MARTNVDWEKYFDGVNSRTPGWQLHVVDKYVGDHKNLSTLRGSVYAYVQKNFDMKVTFVKKLGNDIVVIRIRR